MHPIVRAPLYLSSNFPRHRGEETLSHPKDLMCGATLPLLSIALSTSSYVPPPSETRPAQRRKNWDVLSTEILSQEKEKTTEEDPNVGGDSTLNGFFQKIFADADDETKKAMMKSYSESGGTTLSTNWEEVKKEKVSVKPPQGAEWKNWG